MSRPVAPPGLVSVDTIRRMAAQIDAREKLDADVEQLLLEASNEFLSDAASHSLRLAKHRGGDALSVDDVVLAVERKWRFKVPGFNQDLTQVIAKTGVKKATTKTHQANVAAVRAAAIADEKNSKGKKGEGSTRGRKRKVM